MLLGLRVFMLFYFIFSFCELPLHKIESKAGRGLQIWKNIVMVQDF